MTIGPSPAVKQPTSSQPAARPKREAQHAHQLIAVASGKGGVGKTWLSVTLAHAFARAGRRTLLFDGDLGLANVDIQLGLMPSHDLSSVIAHGDRLQDATTPFEDGGFDIIAGRSGSGRLANLPGNRFQQVIDGIHSITASYDHVIMDLGAGVDRTVCQLSRISDLCIVVATNEPTSLTDAYAFIKLNQRAGRMDHIRVVINMVESKAEGERTYETLRKACESFLKASPPLLGFVRRDAKVPAAIRHQTPILTRFPTSDAASDVETITNRILKTANPSRSRV
ncbi:MAG: MinD/ParA family protein [Hyphomicrobiales bacterium]|nr:MinD/ParA family protein [Hyphomicrobiales bacterium]